MRKLLGSGMLLASMTLLLTACPGDDTDTATTRDTGTTAGTPATGGAPPAQSPAIIGDLPPGVTTEMVAQGQQLYGTVCVACHGPAGTGTPLGPSLNDQNWIHIGGEYEEIVQITRTGVAQPREYPAPMPPNGGGNFNDEQLRSISAYVYTLSRGGA